MLPHASDLGSSSQTSEFCPGETERSALSAPRSSPCFAKVGEHAAVFQIPAVRASHRRRRFVYSKKYQAAKLYEALRDRVAALARHLDRGDITRDAIAAIAKRENQTEAKNKISAQPAENGSGYSLVAFLPSANDLKLISATYPSADTLRRALGLYDDLAEAAAAVVFAPICHLPSVIERLLPACGFNSAKYVFLLRRPDRPSLLDFRGRRDRRAGCCPAHQTRERRLAAQRRRDRPCRLSGTPSSRFSKGKLLMFSTHRRAGWHTRTWAAEPTL